MKLSLTFLENLADFRRQLGIDEFAFESIRPEIRDVKIIERELEQGVEIDSGNVELTGPFLTYQGVQALLYIKDTRHTLERIRNEPERSKKFHLVWCKTLVDMDERGKFGRYVLTRRKDGIFKVDAFTDDSKTELTESEEALLVCKNCLAELEYNDYRTNLSFHQKNALVRTFEIEKFLDEYEGVVRYLRLPSETDNTAPVARYTVVYSRRSAIVKKNAGYICQEEKCGVDLSRMRRLLHCHHIDNKKYNNAWSNLVAICARCHKKRHHPEMYVSRADIELVEAIMTSQGIPL